MIPKVSVIITHYNQPDVIIDAVESVLQQRVDFPFEIIVYDDCSDTEHNLNKILLPSCEKYGNNNLTELSIIYGKPNKKLPGARNTGISYSKGEYIVCLDGDDQLPSNYINSQLKFMLLNNIDVAYTPSQCFGTSSIVYPWPDFIESNLRIGNFINCSAMYTRKMWDEVKGYDESLVYGYEDYDFWLKGNSAGYKFMRNTGTFLLWRQTTSKTQMTQGITKENSDAILATIKTKHNTFFGRA